MKLHLRRTKRPPRIRLNRSDELYPDIGAQFAVWWTAAMVTALLIAAILDLAFYE